MGRAVSVASSLNVSRVRASGLRGVLVIINPTLRGLPCLFASVQRFAESFATPVN